MRVLRGRNLRSNDERRTAPVHPSMTTTRGSESRNTEKRCMRPPRTRLASNGSARKGSP